VGCTATMCKSSCSMTLRTPPQLVPTSTCCVLHIDTSTGTIASRQTTFTSWLQSSQPPYNNANERGITIRYCRRVMALPCPTVFLSQSRTTGPCLTHSTAAIDSYITEPLTSARPTQQIMSHLPIAQGTQHVGQQLLDPCLVLLRKTKSAAQYKQMHTSPDSR